MLVPTSDKLTWGYTTCVWTPMMNPEWRMGMLEFVKHPLRRIPWLLRAVRRIRGHPEPIFGMIAQSEIEYLRSYARADYSGSGEIVDLGCWLGATTISLSQGLEKNPAARR